MAPCFALSQFGENASRIHCVLAQEVVLQWRTERHFSNPDQLATFSIKTQVKSMIAISSSHDLTNAFAPSS